MQADKHLSSVSISKPEDTLSCSSVIDFLSGLSDTIQNLWWLFILIFTVLVLIVALFSIRRKANKFTNKQIDRLIKDGKYIPGIFVGMIVLFQKISSNIILHWKIRENNCRFKRLLNYICCVLNYMM